MGFFKKPKTSAPTVQELELERRQRSELDKLTREENERLKAIKRGARGRRSLLGGPVADAGGQGGRRRLLGSGPRGRGGGPRGRRGGGTGTATGGARRGILGSGTRRAGGSRGG